MLCLTPVGAIKKTYGSRSVQILKAIDALGSVVDVTGIGPPGIQAKIASLSAAESICLIGSYNILPPFSRKNPTSHLSGDTDKDIKTDAPYGAPPGSMEDELAWKGGRGGLRGSATADVAARLAKKLGVKMRRSVSAQSGDVEFTEQTRVGKRSIVVQVRGGKVKQVLKRAVR